ncbi:hypothetical protein HCU64_09830 [Methylobacterium sp. C25]|uniref:hypothetical protein n=1 Tax=Methylobacterium sp. C25 TaxID=2721622 RepID=UPI001F35AF9B|nr:hypothetical protein [Methylobacterium sp. C25]MCE4224050.1 hypothetical protein [Methylobacterium sp. C25]
MTDRKPHPLLAGLENLDGPALAARFAEVRRAAYEIGAHIEADGATRNLHMATRAAIRLMISGIDIANYGPPGAAAKVAAVQTAIPKPAPRPSPIRPLPAAKPATPAAPAKRPRPPTCPPPRPLHRLSTPPPPLDPGDAEIPF